MSGNKNPISLLQEQAMAKFKRLPNYRFDVLQIQEFKCTVSLCDIHTCAVAKNKKAAKALAAEKMLLELGLLISNSITASSISSPSQSNVAPKKISNDSSPPSRNALASTSSPYLSSHLCPSPASTVWDYNSCSSTDCDNLMDDDNFLMDCDDTDEVDMCYEDAVDYDSDFTPFLDESDEEEEISNLPASEEHYIKRNASPCLSSSGNINSSQPSCFESISNVQSSEISCSNSVNNIQLNPSQVIPLSGISRSTLISDTPASLCRLKDTSDMITNQNLNTSFNVSDPVSFLEQQMVKFNSLPTYEQINVVDHGTNEPTYYFEVTAGEETAIGSGHTKKEAKANAAYSLLDIFGIKYEDNNTENFDPMKNYIGDLMTYCQNNLRETPKYSVINVSGEAHKHVFTFRCTLGSLVVMAKSSTKKKAKHLSAKAMLEKIKQFKNDIPQDLKEYKISSRLQEEDINERALKRLAETGARNKVKLNAVISKMPLKDYIYLFESGYYGESKTLKMLNSSTKSNICMLANPFNTFKSIIGELKIEYELSKLDTKTGILLNLFLKTEPKWSFMEVGTCFEESKKKISISALEFFYDMSST